MRYSFRWLVAMTAVGPPALAALWLGDVGRAFLIVAMSYIFLADWLSESPAATRKAAPDKT